MRLRSRAIALGAAVAVVGSAPLIVGIAAGAVADVLLSRGRPADASSVVSSYYAGDNAVDGGSGTRWASAGGPGTQWLRIDLGRIQPISRVRLQWHNAYATAYRVQTSTDGAAWTSLFATQQGNGGIDDLRRLAGTGRYVRLLATQGGTPSGYSLWEAQVFGAGRPAPAIGSTAGPTGSAAATDLTDPAKKELAMRLVSSAENSTLNWRAQYGYLEDLHDGRGYTGGIVGFCSGTSDMLAVVTEYARRRPGNRLARYLPALRAVNGSASHAGLDPTFLRAWKAAATDVQFQRAQVYERDHGYFLPAVTLARTDRLRALGQFVYYDANVMHGPSGLREIRYAALRAARSPAQGGDEVAYLDAFLDARVALMRTETAHSDTTRVDTAQRRFLRATNLDLNLPLTWKVYGDEFSVAR